MGWPRQGWTEGWQLTKVDQVPPMGASAQQLMPGCPHPRSLPCTTRHVSSPGSNFHELNLPPPLPGLSPPKEPHTTKACSCWGCWG